MFKKFFSCFFCFLFVFCYGLTVFSESNNLDSKLSDVTLKVKRTLSISDEFSNFDSSVNDYIISKMWTLKWSTKNNSITATCDDNGKIYSYSTSSNDTSYIYQDNSNFSPIFTKDTFDKSKKSALDFLNKVLDKNESISFYDSYDKLSTNLQNYYYFNGIIKINDLDTPFSFSISVDSSNFKVTNFHRSGFTISYVNNIPSNSPKVSSSYAKSNLFNTCSFKIEYAMDYDKKIARLYYLPSMNQNYYIDAMTGKLVNKSSLYSNINNDSNDILLTATRGDAKNLVEETVQLTEVELSNIAKLHDVLDKSEIDSIIKSKEELGLSNYSLSTMHYTTVQNSDDIYCNLTYYSSDDFASLGLRSKPKNNCVIHKYIKANAKNGDIISISTSYPYYDKKDNLISTSKKNYHKDFLTKYESKYFAKTKLYQKNSSSFNTKRETFVYAQKQKGYFFPDNNLSITVNKYTGFVDSFNKTWNDNIKFESSKNIISLDEAKNLYFDSCDLILSYISIPSKITENIDVYKKLGYDYLNQLTLAYTLKNKNNVYRIHARTGKLIGNQINNNDFVYSDISYMEDIQKDKILKLAQHGIGFEHTKFNPNKKLTQLDTLVLFINALGYSFDSSTISSNDLNNLYSIAYRYNFIKPSERKPSKFISREEFLKIMLSASEYKSVAKLKDIFKCDFSDSSKIKSDLLGYVCVAKSLGLISGDSQNEFNPNKTATRLDAALILYNFMEQGE